MVLADAGRGRHMQTAEDHDQILPETNVFTQPHRAEEVNQIAVDRSAIVDCHVTKEDHQIVMRFGLQLHIAEEDHGIAIHLALGAKATEETDRIVNR